MASLSWKLTLLTCVAFQGRTCLGLRQPLSQCLQKDHLSRAVMSALVKKEPIRKSRSPYMMGCPPTEFIDPPRRREDLGLLLRSRGLKGIGVEVGVQRGNYSRTLLEGWNKAALFIQVDLWEHQENYKDYANVGTATQHLNMREACEEAFKAGHTGKVVQCKDFSTACAKLIPDGSVDFVYIDARHDRKGVLEDLAAYWPKLRVGGIIAGHDYMTQSEVGTAQDWKMNYDGTIDVTGQTVRGAVNDFFSGTFAGSPQSLKACPRQPVITYREQWWNTWIVAK
eukprot:UN0312